MRSKVPQLTNQKSKEASLSPKTSQCCNDNVVDTPLTCQVIRSDKGHIQLGRRSLRGKSTRQIDVPNRGMCILNIRLCNLRTVDIDSDNSLRTVVGFRHEISRREAVFGSRAGRQGLTECDVKIRVGSFIVDCKGVDAVVAIFGYAVVVVSIVGAWVDVCDGPWSQGAGLEITILKNWGCYCTGRTRWSCCG